jgi:hypothetical protein
MVENNPLAYTKGSIVDIAKAFKTQTGATLTVWEVMDCKVIEIAGRVEGLTTVVTFKMVEIIRMI